MEKHRGAIGAGILAAVMMFAVLMIFVGAVQGPNETRTIHKFVGNGECKEKEIPIQAPANGWEEGPCPPERQPDPTLEPTKTVLPTSVPPATATDVPPTKVPTKPPPPATATNTPQPQPTDKPTDVPTEEPTKELVDPTPDTPTPVVLQTRVPLVFPTSDAICAQTVIECEFCCPGEEAKNYAQADEAYARADIWHEIARAMRENIIWDILYKFAER